MTPFALPEKKPSIREERGRGRGARLTLQIAIYYRIRFVYDSDVFICFPLSIFGETEAPAGPPLIDRSFGARRVAALFPNGNRTARLSEIFDPPLGSRHTHSIIYGWCRCEGWAAAVGGSHVDCTSAATDRCNNVEVECVHRTDAKIFAQCAANEKSKHGRKGGRGRMGCSRDVQKKSIE